MFGKTITLRWIGKLLTTFFLYFYWHWNKITYVFFSSNQNLEMLVTLTIFQSCCLLAIRVSHNILSSHLLLNWSAEIAYFYLVDLANLASTLGFSRIGHLSLKCIKAQVFPLNLTDIAFSEWAFLFFFAFS